MSWQDRLQPGRFRDADFLFEGADGELGRRVALHEYPLRDKPYAEDLGRKARRLTLQVYVLGPDYMAGRDRLIAAIEAPGPGTLVHPRLGSLQVTVLECQGPRESSREGGMARFEITFVEAGEAVFPGASADTPGVVRDRAAAARAAAEQVFGAIFETDGRPEWVSGAAQGIVGEWLGDLRVLSAGGMPGPLGEYLTRIDRLAPTLPALVRAPAALGTVMGSLTAGLGGLFALPSQALARLRGLFRFGAGRPAVPQTTATRRQLARNQTALHGLARQAAVIEAARASSGMTFASFQEAAAVREELAGELDEQMLTAPDALYPALQDLRVAVIRDITARGADLARVVRYTSPAVVPSVVLAHRLYGDATRESGIIQRNRIIRHPGFVPGGRALEVLTDAV